MKLAFYRDCEPHLDRRQFLKLVLVAGAIPAPVPNLFGDEEPNAGVRHLIERYEIIPDDPWILVHEIRAIGTGLSVKGEWAAAYGVRTFMDDMVVDRGSDRYIPSH